METTPTDPRSGSIVTGPGLSEPVEVLAMVPMGASLKVIGSGRSTGLARDPVPTRAQLAQLTVLADREPFDGDARMFRQCREAQRLGLAYEYDPFFLLSIGRVDPLPHQLEAVYSHFMRLPRIRFPLADHPGAGTDAPFWRLAPSLSAPYPKEDDQKRWGDEALALKRGLGL